MYMVSEAEYKKLKSVRIPRPRRKIPVNTKTNYKQTRTRENTFRRYR